MFSSQFGCGRAKQGRARGLDNKHSRYPYFGSGFTRTSEGKPHLSHRRVACAFEPLGAAEPGMGFVLHETGYWPDNCAWNWPNVYSPFWRICFDFEAGHHMRFGEKLTPLGPDRVLVIPDHQRCDYVGDVPVTKLFFAFTCARNAAPGCFSAMGLPLVFASSEKRPVSRQTQEDGMYSAYPPVAVRHRRFCELAITVSTSPPQNHRCHPG